MPSKFEPESLSSGFASTDLLNDNFQTLETLLQQMLSRDGTSPNAMNAVLDMNSNNIINGGTVYADGFAQNGGTDFLAAMQAVFDAYSAITTNVTISQSSPSGGSDGDIWFKVP